MECLSAERSNDFKSGTSDERFVSLLECDMIKLQGVCFIRQLLEDHLTFVRKNVVESRDLFRDSN